MPVRVEGKLPPKASASWFRKLAKLAARALDRENDDIAVVFVSAGKMAELNSSYRRKKGATDVLSFPAEASGDLGDIFICVSEANKKAKLRGLSEREYLALLVVHSVLHLGGYDHRTLQETAKMNKLENQILNQND
jgi:rRNA maturation RNase YbeY